MALKSDESDSTEVSLIEIEQRMTYMWIWSIQITATLISKELMCV